MLAAIHRHSPFFLFPLLKLEDRKRRSLYRLTGAAGDFAGCATQRFNHGWQANRPAYPPTFF